MYGLREWPSLLSHLTFGFGVRKGELVMVNEDSMTGANSQTDAVLLRREPRAESAAIAGVAFALLGGAAQWLILGPLGMTDGELDEWLANDPASASTLTLALNLAALSAIAFLWFVAVIRRRVGNREDRFFGTVFFGASMILLATWAIGMCLLAAPGLLDEETLRSGGGSPVSLLAAARALLLVMLPRFEAIFVISTSTILLRTGAAPRWVALVGYAAGLGLIVLPLFEITTLAVFQPWVALLSVVIFFTARYAEA